MPIYSATADGEQIGNIPASDSAEPVPFIILEDTGGSRVKIGLASDTDNIPHHQPGGGINLPDILPSIAYALSGGKFRAVEDKELPSVTGVQTAAQKFSSRLNRYEYVAPCMYTLAERLAQLQKAAMANGETIVLCEAFRPASVQSAVCDAFGKLSGNDRTAAAGMDKAIPWGMSVNRAGLSPAVPLTTRPDNLENRAEAFVVSDLTDPGRLESRRPPSTSSGAAACPATSLPMNAAARSPGTAPTPCSTTRRTAPPSS